MATQVSVFLAFFLYLGLASNVPSRNWPVWGHDSQHTRFQASEAFNGSLCGVDNTMSFPTSASQSVVDEGILIYTKASSGTVSGYNLITQSNAWTSKNLVATIVDTAKPSNLTSPIFLGVVDDAEGKVIVGGFTVHLNGTTFTALFALNGTGSLLWSATKKDTAPLKSIVVYSSSLVLLSTDFSLDAVSLNILNGTAPTYNPEWTYTYNGTASVAVLSDDIVVYSGSHLAVLNATTGNPKKAMTLQDAGAVVFVTPDMIVLASDKTSTIISYPAFDKTVLFTTLILAMGPNNTFVGYETDVKRVTLRSFDAPHTIHWSQAVNVPKSGSIVASVDGAGLVYILTSGSVETLWGLDLTDGKVAWTWDHQSGTALSSPMIASAHNYTFLFVDDKSGNQQVYSPACTEYGKCIGLTCVCDAGQGYYGPSCKTYCVANATCSEHGICTEEGKCSCFDGFYGGDCTLFCQDTGNITSGRNCFHGKCHADVGACVCDDLWFGPKCDCNANSTCNNHGSCDATGFCVCNNTGGMFATHSYQGPNCEWGVNMGIIAIIIGIIALGMLCGGLGICCCCAKYKKAEKGQFSLLPSSEVQRH